MFITESKLRSIISSVLAEGIYDPGILKAVFMAGGPGSGKSYTAKVIFGADPKSLINVSTDSGLKIVNSDPAFEHFLKAVGVDPADLGKISKEKFAALTNPKDPESPRSKAKTIKALSQKTWTGEGAKLGVIIDGTGHDFTKIAEKKELLEELGYDTYMVFVNTSLEVAQDRNADRSRKLPEDLVEDMWSKVQNNLGRFQGLFGASNLMIVDNTVYGPLEPEIAKAINRFVNFPVKNIIGREWIENELEARGGGTKKERTRLLTRRGHKEKPAGMK
jgi:chloramphenicol 3-O-phosphotransferase